jgi:hypothetical protein
MANKRKRERNVEIFISHKRLFSIHSQVLLAMVMAVGVITIYYHVRPVNQSEISSVINLIIKL